MRARLILLVGAAFWCGAMLHRGALLAWDEIEFFRATRWIADGRVPYRDFWEHHTPLQWLVFAPIARVFSNGPGAMSIVALRWAQVPLWIAIFAIALTLARRAGVEPWGRWCVLTCLVVSPWFVWAALEYRLDVPGNLSLLGAILVLSAESPRRWSLIGAGALMAAAVLSNMRLAPLVLATTAIAFVWNGAEKRWSWNPRAVYLVVGGAAIAALFILYLQLSGAMPGFMEGVVWYNRASGALVPDEASSFLVRLAAPVLEREIAGTMFLAFSAVGLIVALRELRRPGVLQVLALLAMVSFLTIAVMKVHYQYHYQTPVLLLMPLAGLVFDRVVRSWRNVVFGALAVALALDLFPVAGSSFGAELQYQNRVMVEVDRRTHEGDRVWDGCGRALRREPSYRYWFLPAGVRLLAQAQAIEPYDAGQMAAQPPAAILYDFRTRFWMTSFPRLRIYAMHHYIPLYQHLWIPGMSALVAAGPARTVWRVPRSGRYDVRISELLARHPWFSRPQDYGVMEGTELEIPLDRIPPVSTGTVQWLIDGVPTDARSGVLALRAGSVLELQSAIPRPAGVVVVPHGLTSMSIMPEVSLVF